MDGFLNRMGAFGLAGFLGLLGTISLLSITARGAEDRPSDLMRLGAEEERAGHPAAAAAAYEALLRRDASFEKLLMPRLVELNIASGHPAEALSWARRVMRKHPAPQAYLAGVYTRLGQLKEAELLLRQTIARTDTDGYALRPALLWQLADVQEAQGNTAAAATTLKLALESAGDDATRTTTTQRLAALYARQIAAQTNRPPARADKNVGVRP